MSGQLWRRKGARAAGQEPAPNDHHHRGHGGHSGDEYAANHRDDAQQSEEKRLQNTHVTKDPAEG